MNDRPPYLLGAFAIVRDEKDRILLNHRTDMDAWDLPGGSLETDELPDEAVLREAREETGLEISVEALTGIYKIEGRNELVFVFTARVLGGEITPGKEVDRTEYVAVDELPENLLSFHRAVIHDAVGKAQKPLLTRRPTSLKP